MIFLHILDSFLLNSQRFFVFFLNQFFTFLTHFFFNFQQIFGDFQHFKNILGQFSLIIVSSL